MAKQERPPIPSDIRRAVRQRCGFGCVICGKSIYQVDHIREWSEVQLHEEHNLTLLCHEHHDQKTRGRLDLYILQEANQKPFNIGKEYTTPTNYSTNSSDEYQVKFAAIDFIWRDLFDSQIFPVLILDGIQAISFTVRNRRALLNLRAYDEAGHLLLLVEEGDVVIATTAWDCELVGNHLTIRTGAGRIAIEIRFRGEGPEILRSHFYGLFGTKAAVDSDGLMAQTGGMTTVIHGGHFEQGCTIIGPGFTQTAVDRGGGIKSESLVNAHERLASGDGLRLLLQQFDAGELMQSLLGQASSAGRAQKDSMPDRARRSFDSAIKIGEALLVNFDTEFAAHRSVLHYNIATSYRLLANILSNPEPALVEALSHLEAAVGERGYTGLNEASAKTSIVKVSLQLADIGHVLDLDGLTALLAEAKKVFERCIPLGLVNNPGATMTDFEHLEAQLQFMRNSQGGQQEVGD